MSQNGSLEKWLFKHFVSNTPEFDFSQVIDLEEEVHEREQRIAQIPAERGVEVLASTVLDESCKFVVDDEWVYIEDFDLDYLNTPNVRGQSGNVTIEPVPGHSRDPKYMSGRGGLVAVPSTVEGVLEDQDCPENYHPAQVGSGKPNKKPSLFTVLSDSARFFKKFNMQGLYYQVDIPSPIPGTNTERWLRSLINGIIDYFRRNSSLAVRPGDYVGLHLANACFPEKPVYVGLRRMGQLDADIVFEKILVIFDSNKEFFINGRMEIEFNHVQMPHGSGLIRRRLGQSSEEFIQGSPSFIKYENPQLRYPGDENCLPYAIILGMAALDKSTTKFRKYSRSINKLRVAALKLCRLAGVVITPGGCSIGEVPKFQAVLPGYQIVIYQSLESKHVPYTDMEYHQKDRKINILLSDGHYTAMRTLQACMAVGYICPDCHTRAPSRKKHTKCVYTCPCCLAKPPCTPMSAKEMINCRDCLRSFRGPECFVNHYETQSREVHSVCQRIKTCGECRRGYYVDDNDPHECGMFYCVTCEGKREYGHQCFMPVYTTKRDAGSNVLYVLYDLETQQNTLLEPPTDQYILPDSPVRQNPGGEPPAPKYKHIPNLCVLQTYCHTCQGVEDISLQCVDCGDRQRVLFSNDCVQDLLSFIVTKANERKPIVEEEEEEEGEEDSVRPRKRRKRLGEKRFKKIVAISHNMGGFDGQFILNYVMKSGRFPVPNMIVNGTRIIQMNLGFGLSFLDSLNYFHTSLSKLPAMFGFEGEKGWYPHLFNTPENAGYIGTLVDRRYYSPESMTKKGRAAFDEWYDSHPEDYVFNNDEELVKYCIQDVNILRKACMKFSSDFWEVNKIDPFLDACTIAGACNKVYRSNYLAPDTIGIVPANGYRYRDNQSRIALKWLSLIELRQGIEIRHAGRSGEKYITGVGKVDGFHEGSNTVYEFMGCFYHGCEGCYPNQYLGRGYNQPGYDDEPAYTNPPNAGNDDDERNQTMFIRRENTERKCKLIRDLGYKLIVMWECDFRKQLRQDRNACDLLRDLPILKNEPLNPRDAFYGGRTKATKLYFKSDGVTKMHYYDICSLYPYINKIAKCPVSHPKVHIGEACATLAWQNMDGLMKVTVRPPRKLYNPVLPARMHSKLMFFLCNSCAVSLDKCECGHTDAERSITGTWVIDEVKLALSHGYKIEKIHEIWEYEVTQYDPVVKKGGVFVGYINRFLKIKAEASGWPQSCNTDAEKDAYINEFYEREGILLDRQEIRFNPALRQMAKDQLNSFWGRFGLRPDLIRTTIVKCYDDLVMKMFDPKLVMDSIIPVNDESILLSYREREEHRLPNNTANVVIAAFTTAYARMELYKYLDMLGPERIFYFDTDSIFFTSRPGEPMPPIGPFLGQMTDELEKYGVGTYIIEFASGGPKNYTFKAFTPSTGETHTVVKVKGITLNYETESIVNFELIKKFVLASVTEVTDPDVEEEYREKNTVQVHLHSIRRTNTAEVYSTKTKKTYRINYTKRKLAEGFDTLPYGY